MNRRKSVEERFISGVKEGKPEECWEWTGQCTNNGYGRIRTFDRSCYLVHRIAWERQNGAIPEGLVICHICDNRKCQNTAHMFLGTQAENLRDMVEKGRSNSGDKHWSKRMPEKRARGDRSGAKTHPEKIPRGEKHGMVKLQESDIPFIRFWADIGHPQLDIASAFDVSRSAISMIITRNTWRFVE